MLGPREIGAFACVVNFGILVFNLGFTHADALAAPNAAVFSPFGQVMVLVWGIAFLLAGLTNGDGRPSGIWWAFAFEKLCYVCAGGRGGPHGKASSGTVDFRSFGTSRMPKDGL